MTVPTNQPLEREQIELFKTYHRRNIEWGNLHIVLADKNVKNSHVQFCREQCVKNNDAEGLVLCDILLTQSKSQRLKLAGRF